MRSARGFTLIELMITIAIVGILAGISLPSYMEYQKKARYAELVTASAPHKKGVEICYQTRGTLTGCSQGTNGVPALYYNNVSGTTLLVWTINGVIYVYPRLVHGFTYSDNYILTPTAVGGGLTWAVSGGAVNKGYITG